MKDLKNTSTKDLLKEISNRELDSDFFLFETEAELLDHFNDSDLDGIKIDTSNSYSFRRVLGSILNIPVASVTNKRLLSEILDLLP